MDSNRRHKEKKERKEPALDRPTSQEGGSSAVTGEDDRCEKNAIGFGGDAGHRPANLYTGWRGAASLAKSKIQ